MQNEAIGNRLLYYSKKERTKTKVIKQELITIKTE